MGYTTTFTGKLSFTNELTAKELAKVKSFFGEDCRQHPEWNCQGTSYIDLRLTDNFDGIEWDDETEKNYGMVEHVNLIIREMQKEFPELNFGLIGELSAQGEDPDDKWNLIIKDGFALKVVVKELKQSLYEEAVLLYESTDRDSWIATCERLIEIIKELSKK